MYLNFSDNFKNFSLVWILYTVKVKKEGYLWNLFRTFIFQGNIVLAVYENKKRADETNFNCSLFRHIA
ncbi:hypothetical protein UT300002_30650 [Clostridium perfringens]